MLLTALISKPFAGRLRRRPAARGVSLLRPSAGRMATASWQGCLPLPLSGKIHSISDYFFLFPLAFRKIRINFVGC